MIVRHSRFSHAEVFYAANSNLFARVLRMLDFFYQCVAFLICCLRSVLLLVCFHRKTGRHSPLYSCIDEGIIPFARDRVLEKTR